MPPQPSAALPYQVPGQARVHPEKRKPFTLWVVLSTLVGGTIGALGVSANSTIAAGENPAMAIGGWIGATLVTAAMGLIVGLVVATILLVFKKSFRSSLARAYSLATILLAILSLLGNLATAGITRRRQAEAKAEQAKEAIEGMEQDLDKMLAETTNPDGSPRETEFRLESKLPENEMESLRHVVQSVLNDMAGLQNDYMAALKEDGLYSLLQADRLAADENFEESRAILGRSRKRVEEYREKARQMVLGIPKRLDAYSFSDDQKRSFMAGYGKRKDHNLDNLKASWDLEAKILDHMEELIDHLEASREGWSADEKVIVFESDDDLAKYKAIMKEIDDCSTKQTELQTKALEAAKSKFSGFKEKLTK